MILIFLMLFCEWPPTLLTLCNRGCHHNARRKRICYENCQSTFQQLALKQKENSDGIFKAYPVYIKDKLNSEYDDIWEKDRNVWKGMFSTTNLWTSLVNLDFYHWFDQDCNDFLRMNWDASRSSRTLFDKRWNMYQSLSLSASNFLICKSKLCRQIFWSNSIFKGLSLGTSKRLNETDFNWTIEGNQE